MSVPFQRAGGGGWRRPIYRQFIVALDDANREPAMISERAKHATKLLLFRSGDAEPSSLHVG